MVLLGVDLTQLAEKLEYMLKRYGAVDIVCAERIYGVLMPVKTIRVRRNDTPRKIGEALLETVFCNIVELKQGVIG